MVPWFCQTERTDYINRISLENNPRCFPADNLKEVFFLKKMLNETQQACDLKTNKFNHRGGGKGAPPPKNTQFWLFGFERTFLTPSNESISMQMPPLIATYQSRAGPEKPPLAQEKAMFPKELLPTHVAHNPRTEKRFPQ